jgi:2-dehydropantoate 2-reductase
MPTRILVVGAGAIGAFFGSRLATLPQVLVSALCRSNYKVVNSNGFKVTSPNFGDYTFKPEYTFSSADHARQVTRKRKLTWDYLLVATKVLPEVSDGSRLLEGLVDDQTSIVLIQNGLGIEESYRKRFPRTTVLSGITMVSATQSSPGTVTHNRWTRLTLGPYVSNGNEAQGSVAEPSVATERTQAFVDMLGAGGIDAIAYPATSLQVLRWHKLAINAAINASSVLTGGGGNAAMAADTELNMHLRGVMNEVLSAGAMALGCETFPFEYLKLATPDQVLASVLKNTSGSRPSMWHDWAEGRKMELEAILGEPVRIARKLELETPRLQALYALLKMAQERRDNSTARL